eukprot:gene43280-53726_t
MDLSFVASGFGVGLLVGMTGVGGGSLMTPILTLLFGVSPSVAVGTDLAFAAVTKTAGTFTHRLRNTVRWDIVRLLCLGAVPAAVAAHKAWGLCAGTRALARPESPVPARSKRSTSLARSPRARTQS